MLVIASSPEHGVRVRIDESGSQHATVAVNFRRVGEPTTKRLVVSNLDDTIPLHRDPDPQLHTGVLHLGATTRARGPCTCHGLCRVHEQCDAVVGVGLFLGHAITSRTRDINRNGACASPRQA